MTSPWNIFAYSLGKPIALAYLPMELARSGAEVQVQSFDRACRASVVVGAPYDPRREKILGCRQRGAA